MRLSVGCLALTLAAAACDDPAAPAPEVVVVAAEADYALGDVVELTIRNASDEPIVVLTCEGGAFVPEVDRREGGEWERVAGLACLPPTPGFVEIAPGDSARPDYSTIPLHEPGTYRFGFLVTEPPVGPSPELRAVFSQAVEIE